MRFCKKCVLPETYPDIHFDEQGVCNFCNEFVVREKSENEARFPNEDALQEALKKYRNPQNKYDIVVPISGGLDSCFTLIQMVEHFKLRPLVFHNDHGYDVPEMQENVKRVCRALDVDYIIWKNDYAFMRKLFKYFNEADERDLSACYVCGNMLYLNGLELADRFHIPLVVNGYSKGQAAMMYNKDWSQNMYGKMIEIILETGDQEFFQHFSKKWELLKKQIVYQNRKDLEKPVDHSKLLFVPFFVFQFYHTNKEALKSYCRERFDWQPMPTSYPARTTNCEMIWLNSYRDLTIRGYTHYHDEYSTLIRAGEYSREQALTDLELKPAAGLLERLADGIGLDLDQIKKKQI
jgi:hypothetical protein